VKLHVVLTPSQQGLDEPGSIGPILEALGVKPPVSSDDTPIVVDIVGPDTPEFRSELNGLCRAIEENFLKAGVDGAQLRLQLPPRAGETEPATSASNAMPTEPTGKPAWSPEAQKLHDFNGYRANAALPRVLSALGGSAALRQKESLAKVMLGGVERSVAIARDSAVRFSRHDPNRGTLISIAECVCQLACRGTAPLAIGCDLNFPSAGEIADLRKIDEAVKAMAMACTYFAFPSIVSLASRPTAATGDDFAPISKVWAAGCFEQERHVTSPTVRAAGARLMFLGEAPHEIGCSTYLAAVHGLNVGDVPAVQLSAEKKLHNVLLTLIRAGVISAAHNVAAGGLMAAVCEMLFAEDRTFGARLDLTPLGGARADALLFGESQGRVIVAVAPERVGTVLSEAHMRGVSAALIGDITADSLLGLKTRSLETEWAIADLRSSREGSPGDAPSSSATAG